MLSTFQIRYELFGVKYNHYEEIDTHETKTRDIKRNAFIAKHRFLVECWDTMSKFPNVLFVKHFQDIENNKIYPGSNKFVA